jgi:hypothetical protein
MKLVTNPSRRSRVWRENKGEPIATLKCCPNFIVPLLGADISLAVPDRHTVTEQRLRQRGGEVFVRTGM